jgi:2-methylisocitrate lyase-like PEP mutase family enzyme
VFVPGIKDAHEIGAIVALGLPLNVLFIPGAATIERLAQLGVARVSTGSGLYRSAIGAAIHAATTIRDGGQPPAAPSYEEIDGYQR